MSLFSHEARQFKFDVLREVAKRGFSGKLDISAVDEIAVTLIPTNHANFRCCVYKEREVIRERCRMALGLKPNLIRKDSTSPRQIVHVLEAACDGCSIHKITVTDNCRKCMAKACMASCKFDAMHMGSERAYIDYSKCKECGACAKACPYSAIVQSERPCIRSCPVNALSMDEDGLAVIDESKCINCGACQAGCPFGAIEDMSQMVPVIEALNSDEKVFAIIAPAIQGQLDSATLPQIKQAIREVGFEDVFEAAIGADAVAKYEKDVILKHKEEGVKVTTSCCPAFVNMARIHFPEVYAKNVSTVVSPMEAIARYIKKYMNGKVVFIGPCVAKKQEAMEDFSVVDYVLTFEEIAAMMVAKGIYPTAVQPKEEDTASAHGRGFAVGGGVSKAVFEAAKEEGDDVTITAKYADGAAECKVQLLLMKLGKYNEDILEGMCCPGGCVCGPATIESPMVVKKRMTLENNAIKEKTIQSTLQEFDFSDIDLHR